MGEHYVTPSEAIFLALLVIGPFLAAAFLLQAFVIATVGQVRWLGWFLILGITVVGQLGITIAFWIGANWFEFADSEYAVWTLALGALFGVALPWLVLPWRKFQTHPEH